jgi:hypothetical protein
MRWIAAFLLLTPFSLNGAQINKCLDASGKVVGYASECPAGSRPEPTKIKSAPASGDTSKSLAEREAEFRKRQIEQQEAAKKAEQKSVETAQRKRACDDTRGYLKSLQERHRVVRTDPKSGEPVFLKEDEYVREIDKARRFLAENCAS